MFLILVTALTLTSKCALAGYYYQQPAVVPQQYYQPAPAVQAPVTTYFQRTFLPRYTPVAAPTYYQPQPQAYRQVSALPTAYYTTQQTFGGYHQPAAVSQQFAFAQPQYDQYQPRPVASTTVAPVAAQQDEQQQQDSIEVVANSAHPEQPTANDNFRGFAYHTDFAGGARSNVVFFSGPDFNQLPIRHRFGTSTPAQPSRTAASDSVDTVAVESAGNDVRDENVAPAPRQQFQELVSFLNQPQDGGVRTFYTENNRIYTSRVPANTRFLSNSEEQVPLAGISPVYPLLRSSFIGKRVTTAPAEQQQQQQVVAEPQSAASERQSKSVEPEAEKVEENVVIVTSSSVTESESVTSAATEEVVVEVATSTVAVPEPSSTTTTEAAPSSTTIAATTEVASSTTTTTTSTTTEAVASSEHAAVSEASTRMAPIVVMEMTDDDSAKQS